MKPLACVALSVLLFLTVASDAAWGERVWRKSSDMQIQRILEKSRRMREAEQEAERRRQEAYREWQESERKKREEFDRERQEASRVRQEQESAERVEKERKRQEEEAHQEQETQKKLETRDAELARLRTVANRKLTDQARTELKKGTDAYNEKDYDTAAKLFKPLAEQGNAEAQAHLGLMYEHGRGVENDHIEAFKWYRLAAEQGTAWAQTNLGLAYSNGRGIEKDDKEATKWYRRAALQGNTKACRQ